MMHNNANVAELMAKKYEILGELEKAKDGILREMSAVDKCSLHKLREILAHYDCLEKSVIQKMNDFEIKTNVFIKNAETNYGDFAGGLDSINVQAEKLKGVTDQVGTLTENISGLTGNVETLTGNIAELTGYVEDLADEIATPDGGSVFFNIGTLNIDNTGASDVSSHLQNAINTYKRVYVPGGTYYLGTPLVMCENAYLLSDPDTVYHWATDCAVSNAEPGDNSEGYDGNSNITIDGGVFDYAPDVYPVARGCMRFAHMRNLTIRNITMLDTNKTHGLELAGCDGVLLENCKFLGYVGTGNTYKEIIQLEVCDPNGFPHYGAGDYTEAKNITVRGCRFAASESNGAPFVAVGAHYVRKNNLINNVVIENNEFEGCSYAAVHAYCFNNTFIRNNIFKSCIYGVRLSGDDDAYTASGVSSGVPLHCNNVMVTGNTFIESSSAAVFSERVDNAANGSYAILKNLSVVNNVFNKCAHSTKLISVQGLLFENNNSYDSTHVVLYLHHGSDAVLIGNRIIGTPEIGFYIDGQDYPEAAHNLVVSNNILENVTKRAFYIRKTEGVTVTGNTIRNTPLLEDDRAIYFSNFIKKGIVSGNVVVSDVNNGSVFFGLQGTYNEKILVCNNVAANMGDVQLTSGADTSVITTVNNIV